MQKKGEKHKTIVGYVLKTSALSISVEKLLNVAILKNALFLRTLNTALQSIVQSLSHTPPTLWAQAVIGWIRVWCRHRSERPFISSLGRWTPHLISNKGNFSILQPIYSDTANNLGFYYFSWPASFFLVFRRFLLVPTGRLVIFPVNFFSVQRQGDISEELWVSTKRACGSLFVFWIGSVSLLERKAWERNCPRQLERLKPRLKNPERLLLHPPRPTDR